MVMEKTGAIGYVTVVAIPAVEGELTKYEPDKEQ